MNKVIALLSDEDLLVKNGINGYSDVFLIENILISIRNRKIKSLDCDLYNLESFIIWTFNKIRNNPLYSPYIDRIRISLEITPISEEVIEYLKGIFEEMFEKFSPYNYSDIMVKKLI